MRTGPGLTYDIVTSVPAGTQATIVGIDPDNDWYQVEIDGVAGQVWIYQGLTTLQGSLTGVKQYTALEIAQLIGTPAADGSVPLAITVPITMNVRSGPGLTYDVVRVVPQGTQGRIWGIDPTDDWFQIELEGLDTLVWVYQDLTTVIGSLAAVRRLTVAEIALLPAAITQPLLLNARAGPGTDYEILATVPQGTWLKITGIDSQGDWYRVELADLEQPAWLLRDFTKVAGGTLSNLIRIAMGGSPSSALTSWITVELSLGQAGGADLEVSWTDASVLWAAVQSVSSHGRGHGQLRFVGAGDDVNGREQQESEFQYADRQQLHIGVVRDEQRRAGGCGSGDRPWRGGDVQFGAEAGRGDSDGAARGRGHALSERRQVSWTIFNRIHASAYQEALVVDDDSGGLLNWLNALLLERGVVRRTWVWDGPAPVREVKAIGQMRAPVRGQSLGCATRLRQARSLA